MGLSSKTPLTEAFSRSVRLQRIGPAHFLVGGPFYQFPEPSHPPKGVALSEKWNLIQKTRRDFWDPGPRYFITQPGPKWWKTKPNLKLGENLGFCRKKTNCSIKLDSWPLINYFFGPDQRVRVFECKSQKRTIN
ncbi:hypothetical protein TNIN_188711 [Trichonephila inaurata madagascariensis]|uniref:Uncharacterized protein n=1 Tax=Trichonephila inaurata madagascariensis TaxID=2747483 RepID=A0A8X6XXF5_9ARAC|nr:hypothetical protein TNIN_188711 [Trichonephila inaurata madagascariensis]